jgi:hypothetical protein
MLFQCLDQIDGLPCPDHCRLKVGLTGGGLVGRSPFPAILQFDLWPFSAPLNGCEESPSI